MVEIRIVVPDAVGFHGPARRLAVDRFFVSNDGARTDVGVCSEWKSRTVVQMVDPVEGWLEEDGASSATPWWGGRPFTMAGPVPIACVP